VCPKHATDKGFEEFRWRLREPLPSRARREAATRKEHMPVSQTEACRWCWKVRSHLMDNWGVIKNVSRLLRVI
jgi:hypothetical protein